MGRWSKQARGKATQYCVWCLVFSRMLGRRSISVLHCAWRLYRTRTIPVLGPAHVATRYTCLFKTMHQPTIMGSESIKSFRFPRICYWTQAVLRITPKVLKAWWDYPTLTDPTSKWVARILLRGHVLWLNFSI